MRGLTAGLDNQAYFYDPALIRFPLQQNQKQDRLWSSRRIDESLSLEAISAESSCRRGGF